MSKQKEVSALFQASDWLDYWDYETRFLAKEDADAIRHAAAFDTCELFVNLEVVAPGETDVKQLEGAISAFEKKLRVTARTEAGKYFAEIANCCRAVAEPEGAVKVDDPQKKAHEAVDKLEKYLDKLVFGVLAAELRRHISKTIGVKADDLTTLNESKIKLRLDPDVFGFGLDSGKSKEAKDKLLMSFQRASKRKDTWLDCCLVWEDKEKIALLVAKPKVGVKNEEIKQAKTALGFTTEGSKKRGVVKVVQSTWHFQFIKGKKTIPKEPQLRIALKEQAENNSAKIKVEEVAAFSFGEDKNDSTQTEGTTKTKKEEATPKTKPDPKGGKSNKDPKTPGKKELALPPKNRK